MSAVGFDPLVVQFALGTPTDRAVNDVRNAISQIRGNLPEGKEFVALCRCGRSQRKPFCDGSHRGCFEAAELAPIPTV